MAFWRPGASAPGLGVGAGLQDRETEGEAAVVTSAVNTRLSIAQQRAKLPIAERRNHILYLVEKYQVLIVVGQTGCGKTTQIPQYLLEAGWAPQGRIVACTQPRRVAATSVAARVADERGSVLGEEVGYTIRFDDCSGPATRIKFLTDGTLLREMMLDPLLSKYTVIMLDEAHERSVSTDITMALLKKVLRKRPDLRVIVSSATVDALAFKKYFETNGVTGEHLSDSAFIMTIEGRMYPVDIHYAQKAVADYQQSVVDTVLSIHKSEPAGDVLVFLTGAEEIDEACDAIRESHVRGRDDLTLIVLPLYSGLPVDDQMRVFEPTERGHRKVVVATNIAETSITIPGIVYVVDCGFVKQKWYDAHTALELLVVGPTSQASAQQRAGRAGRVRPGKAYRLYTEEVFQTLRVQDVPEIQRVNLAGVVLQLKAMGIDDVLHFDFMSPPPTQCLERALELLYALGAFNETGQLTHPTGLRMAEFPVEPMLAKMLFASAWRGCSEEILSIAAMLSVQSAFAVTPSNRQASEGLRRKFTVSEGDHLTLLNVYNNFILQKTNQGQWCKHNHIHQRNLLRATEIRAQLKRYMKRFNLPLESSSDAVEICKSIVAGFFSNAAYLNPDGSYTTVKDRQILHLHPGSVMFKLRSPEWVVFHEVVHTSKKFMRDVTVISPQWLADIAPHFYEYRKQAVAKPSASQKTVGEVVSTKPSYE